MIDIIQACRDPFLFASAFEREGVPPASWKAWIAVLRAMFGLELSSSDLELFRACTGRQKSPTGPFKETWLICGRRGGKSFMMALIAVYLACFFDYRPFLNVGERGTVMIIAADRKQARVVLRYIRGLLSVPTLASMVNSERAEGFDLDNRVTIEIHTASFQTTRGYTIVAALLDEIGFWSNEDSAAPDTEIIRALRPAMGMIPSAKMICASSPYAKRGALWKAFEKHFGKDDSNVLVWKAPTRVMNPSFPQEAVDEALADDPDAAASEYLAEFRNDVASFVAREVVEDAIMPGVYEIPPIPNEAYCAFVDSSGGSADSFTLAIAASKEGENDEPRAQLVCVREFRPPFDPGLVIGEICRTLVDYGVDVVYGDRYAGEFPPEHFRNAGVRYEVSEKSKSEIYRDALPLLNSGRIDLLDDRCLVTQICRLERRVAQVVVLARVGLRTPLTTGERHFIEQCADRYAYCRASKSCGDDIGPRVFGEVRNIIQTLS
jgi:hypothetical protein